jgi:hypothetical protein
MAKHEMPNIPGAAVMTDTLDFVKNLWGSMSVPGISIPGITAPTLSVEELDKKINDLKAVETWLNLNMSMLRTTIQALEVQRGTIATLKSMGASLAAAVQQPPGKVDKPLFESPYASAFFQHAAPAQPAPTPVPVAPIKAAEAEPASDPASSAATQMANPAAWWNLLQDQFKQAVSTTMASAAVAGAAAMASGAAAKFAEAAMAPAAAAPTADSDQATPKKAPVKRAVAKPKSARTTKQ